MKIKKFLEHNKYDNKEIAYSLWLYDILAYAIEFEQRDYERIKENVDEIFKVNGIINYIELVDMKLIDMRPYDINYDFVSIQYNHDNIQINKLPDEWYMLKFPSKTYRETTYYKCDEIDGLIEKIKELVNNDNKLRNIKENVNEYENVNISYTQWAESLDESVFIYNREYGIICEYIKENFKIDDINLINNNQYNYIRFHDTMKNYVADINKLPDEWYLLYFCCRTKYLFLKCDSLKGLFHEILKLKSKFNI